MSLILDTALAIVDCWMAMVPRNKPALEAAENCRVISHRGEHDNRSVHENTLEAFEIARSAGVWGIETDIRWTADLVPVAIHDADTDRVFGKTYTIRNMSFAALREAIPEIPTLAELIDEFGGNTHLMLELKDEEFPELERQKDILNEHLSGLKPRDDYHILALDVDLFETFDIQPRQACVSVSMINARSLSKTTLSEGYGGFTGHYVLLNDRLKALHGAAGQSFGTGFIRSKNCLYRELNRGIEWIFTNDAVEIQGILDALRQKRPTNHAG